MTHVPWIVLGMVLSPALGWLWLAVSDWRNERRFAGRLARGEKRFAEWYRRNQQ